MGGLVDVAGAQGALVVSSNDEDVLLFVVGEQIDLVARQLAGKLLVDGLDLRVEELSLGLPVHVHRVRDHLALVRVLELAHVDLGMLEQQALLLAGRRIEDRQRLTLALQVR